jgi:hypothetical protein
MFCHKHSLFVKQSDQVVTMQSLADTNARATTSQGLRNSSIPQHAAAQYAAKVMMNTQHRRSGGTLNTWRSGDDGRPVTERLQVRF